MIGRSSQFHLLVSSAGGPGGRLLHRERKYSPGQLYLEKLRDKLDQLSLDDQANEITLGNKKTG